MSTGAKKRLVSIQVCRGLAAMAVVFAHLANVEEKYFPTHLMALFHFGISGVDLFFVISGLVISIVTVGKFHNVRNAVTFLYHRFARVYPILWIYSGIVLIAYLHNPLSINASNEGHTDILRSFLLFPSRGAFLVMQGWTLSYEIYFYLLVAVLLAAVRERWASWILGLWGLLIVILGMEGIHGSSPFTGVLISPLVIEFLGGCMIFHIYRRAVLPRNAGIYLLSLSILWFTGVIILSNRIHGGFVWQEFNPAYRMLTFGVFSVLFVLGIVELERSALIQFARPMALVGDWSYSIYLSHIIVVEFLGRLAYHHAPHLPYAILLIALVAVPAIVLIGYLSYTYLELPLLRLLYKPTTRPVSAGASKPLTANK